MNYYEVAAYVDVPWKKDLVVKQPLRVCIQYSSLKFEPTLKTSKKTKGTIFSDSGNIIVQASTKDIGYIGEDHYVNVVC
jgi:ribose 5-phosphate isomerase